MLSPVLIVFLFASLILVAYQDFKMREINALLPVVIFLVLAKLNVLQAKPFIQVLLVNVVLLCLIVTLLTIYLSAKTRSVVNPFKSHLGLGDFLFYISLCPLFNAINYLLFFIFSLLFSLILYKWFNSAFRKNGVPLAGLAALFLLFILILDYWLSESFFLI